MLRLHGSRSAPELLQCSCRRCRGHSISVPHDVEGTLVRRYGPGWRTPRQAGRGRRQGEGVGRGNRNKVGFGDCLRLMGVPHELVPPCPCWERRGTSADGASQPRSNLQHLIERRYLEKGADTVEGSKPYAKLLRMLARLGIRL